MPTQSPSKRRKVAHIVDTMTAPPPPDKTPPGTPPKAPKIPYAQTASPTPNKGKGKETNIPMSTFNAHRAWQPRCNHITMSRVYHVGFRCEHCHRHGSLGWLYRCTQDREILIQDVYEHGGNVAFDDVGRMFAPLMSLGRFGPDRRADPYALLREMTEEEMRMYTPGQIATLLGQREKVRKAATAQTPAQHTLRAYAPTPSPDTDRKPWVPTPQEECQYKICHTCYRGGQDKALLSLNGVLAGDIPPTAATAHTFQYMQMRPVLDAVVVRELGYRAVPLPRYFPTTPSSQSSDWSVMEIIDHHLQSSDEPIASASPPPNDDQRQTEYGPVWWSDRADSTVDETTNLSDTTHQPSGLTPPPASHQLHPPRDLRPPPGLYSLPNTTLTSTKSPPLPDHLAAVKNLIPDKLTPAQIAIYGKYTQDALRTQLKSLQRHAIPSSSHQYATTRLTLNSDDDTLALAATTPLPRPSIEEDLFLLDEKTAMEEEEDEQGLFHKEPLVVPGGVALTEEGVGEGRADIVAIE